MRNARNRREAKTGAAILAGGILEDMQPRITIEPANVRVSRAFAGCGSLSVPRPKGVRVKEFVDEPEPGVLILKRGQNLFK